MAGRRDILILGGGLALFYGGTRLGFGALERLRADDFDFEALNVPAGYRRIEGGPITGTINPLIGLDIAEAPAAPRPSAPTGGPALCKALFGDVTGPDVVPIASFSDYNCPYCRVLTRRLLELEAEDKGVQVSWHELPLLGPSSIVAARGALAARRQGAYLDFHRRLMRAALVPTEAYATQLASDLGLDPARFAEDYQGSAVTRELSATQGLADLFNFYATPALVVGRTAVLGNIPLPRLEALIERERRDGPPPG